MLGRTQRLLVIQTLLLAFWIFLLFLAVFVATLDLPNLAIILITLWLFVAVVSETIATGVLRFLEAEKRFQLFTLLVLLSCATLGVILLQEKLHPALFIGLVFLFLFWTIRVGIALLMK